VLEVRAFGGFAEKLHGLPKRKNAEISHLLTYRQRLATSEPRGSAQGAERQRPAQPDAAMP
jgi:hypothetical protein